MTKKEKVRIFKEFLDKEYGTVSTFLKFDKNEPWQFLICVILSSQTTDNMVNKVTPILFKKYDTLEKLSSSNYKDIYQIIKPLGLSSKKAEYIKKTSFELLNKFNGELPKERNELMSLSGVGYKTSGVVLGELFNYPYIPVDTHVEYVAKTLGLVDKKISVEETEHQLEKLFSNYSNLINIHKQMILFGRNVCKKGKTSKYCWDYIFNALEAN